MWKRELVALLSFVFLVSRDGSVVLPRGAMGLRFVNVVFPGHTHLLFNIVSLDLLAVDFCNFQCGFALQTWSTSSAPH